jgi:hypothetical protein
MVIWLSGEDAPSNVCTVLIVQYSNEFRLSATVAVYCDTSDACIVAVLEDEVITAELAATHFRVAVSMICGPSVVFCC